MDINSNLFSRYLRNVEKIRNKLEKDWKTTGKTIFLRVVNFVWQINIPLQARKPTKENGENLMADGWNESEVWIKKSTGELTYSLEV